MSRRNSGQNSNSVLMGNLLQSVLTKEPQYKDPIKKNHQVCKISAQRLALQGEVEQALMNLTEKSSVDDDSEPPLTAAQVQEFLQEERQRLQQLAQQNVQTERNLEIFLASIRTLQQQFANGDGGGGDDAEADNVVDYEAKIRQLMQQHEATTPALDFTQEMYYREVCQEMGVKIADAKKAANDDEDIEVVGNRSQSAGMSLKCPITTVLLEAPVRNKFCKHVYSKEAILSHIRQKNRQCPVPGCHNRELTKDQLEDDGETEMKVRREKRRLEREQELRVTQDLVDTDEED